MLLRDFGPFWKYTIFIPFWMEVRITTLICTYQKKQKKKLLM